ncbi:carbonic anhydrase family protein [Frigoribacterium sp. CFBP 8754]|uniref:carbonic anhydrase n=1 Tax=Frigoribacterium sp. CFBP 8754 TaxID=2775290 RepID=UPI00177A7680|nr:carbonic anhydrase family protein [Frigoribacterium sp. CFBP 8754]MBD8661304.1 carbonic anhydrase family protein [Frigoribacterium sp. CFBP 8754]
MIFRFHKVRRTCSTIGSDVPRASSTSPSSPSASRSARGRNDDRSTVDRRADGRRRRRLPLAVGAGLAVAALAGCSLPGGGAEAPFDPVRVPPASATWSYGGETGPDRWGSLSSAWSTCATGLRQSPVDLAGAVPGAGPATDAAGSPAAAPTLSLAWGPVELDVDDDGHGAHLETEGAATAALDGRAHKLVQFHAHAPSEHVVDGRPASGEVHFVHRAADGSLAVVGLLVQVGEHSPAWEPVVAAVVAEAPRPRAAAPADDLASRASATTETGARIDPRGGAPRPGDDLDDDRDDDLRTDDLDDPRVDLATLLPGTLDHVRYDGSLTTPPCTEGVSWAVLSSPVTMSAEQLAVLAGGGDTARPVQELGDRLLTGTAPVL